FFSSRRRHTRSKRDWSSDVCSSDLSYLGNMRAFKFIHLVTKIAITYGFMPFNVIATFFDLSFFIQTSATNRHVLRLNHHIMQQYHPLIVLLLYVDLA